MEKLLSKNGQLASIEDVFNKPIASMVLTREGVFSFVSAEQNRKILIECGDIEELDEIEDTWLQTISLENYLYQWFMGNRFDEGLMTVVHKDMIDEILIVSVKMINPIWDYEYWIFMDEYGNIVIDEKDIILDQEEHDKKFGIGKYEKTVEDLERYERSSVMV